MKINPKSEKGAITLVVLIGMLFLTAFLMSVYIGIANRAQSSAETTKQISEQYNNLDEAESIYDSYFANTDVIPIYTKEQLAKIGSGEQVLINNKVYTFSTDAYYTIQTDLDLGGVYDEDTAVWSGEEWTPLTSDFTGTLDGLGHTITGLYINNLDDNQGLFGTLKGTVKNLSIEDSYIKANSYVGSIAGKNEGTIINCYNTASIIGNTNVTGGYFKSISTGEQIDVWSDSVLEENAYFVSGTYTATAPKGFKVSKNVLEQTIEEGMVIQDSVGNEFVWVPVEVTSTDTKTSIASFYRSEWANNARSTNLMNNSSYVEPYTGNNWEVEEYNAMVESVYNNHGFYIGRYEAGSNENRAITRTDETVLVQKGKYPYNYVAWGTSMKNYEDEYIPNSTNYGHGAVYLSKNMYTDENLYGVVSTLCYGVQWDTMLDFVKDDNHSVTSSNWGNYNNTTFTFIGKYSEDYGATWKDSAKSGTVKDINISYLLTTGASEKSKAKNIYDIAGNCKEWTMESNGTYSRFVRGGYYAQTYSSYPASYRTTMGPAPTNPSRVISIWIPCSSLYKII